MTERREPLCVFGRERGVAPRSGSRTRACRSGRATPSPSASSAKALVIYADAALECPLAGYGAWAVAGDELLFVEGQWSEEERQLLICDLELAASTIGLVALQPLCRERRHVYSFTDNTVAMAALRGLVPSTEAMQAITQRRVEWLLAEGVSESTERITSNSNLWADAL